MYFKIITFVLLSQTFIFAQTGLASWYGKKFEGRITSSGEPFNMYGYTAAHKTLPFGTMVTVTNLKNGQSVEVKVNDRGPYECNRIMDISYQAAKSIGLVRLGTTKVKIVEQYNSSSALFLPPNNEVTLVSMREYASIIGDSKKELNQSSVPISKIINPQSIQVQIASSSSKKAAEKFLLKERYKGYNMTIISTFSVYLQQVRHRVLILCDSKKSALAIIKSKEYKGAYIFH